MLRVYEAFMNDYLAVPVICGDKTASERFPGAVKTFCLEAMVQDRKAIQAGTSHFLGQNFAKAAGIEFQSREGKLEHAWTTSWGASTRMVGMLLMTHGDDDGAIIPPRIAASQVVIIPFIPKEEHRAAILQKAEEIAAQLRAASYEGEPVRVEIDTRDVNGSTKNWDWIKRGAPLRLEIGPRDLEAGTVALARRDRGPKEKESLALESLTQQVPAILAEIQLSLFDRALTFQQEHTKKIDTKEEFYQFFTPKNSDKPEIHGGFALTHWNGCPEVEAKIKEDLKVTIRCIPFEETPEADICPFSGEPSRQRVVFGKSY